jgi:hypothetical protein
MFARAFAAMAFVALSTAAASAQQPFEWRGRVAAGRTVEIKGISGDIKAVAGSDEVRVLARKSGRQSDTAAVRIQVLEHAQGVTICALYPAPEGRPANECAPGRGGRSETGSNDVQVHFEVQIPQGVNFTARNVSGGVSATGLAGDVEAWTVNGAVDVSTSGLARAASVNGNVAASFGRIDWNGNLEFESVNGSLAVALPGSVSTAVNATTVNGGIASEFPLTIQGRFGPRTVSGTIGSGGRTLTLKTVNGSIEIRRR